jgi:hypothetical protein
MRLAKFCKDGDRCKPEPPTDKTRKNAAVIGGAAIGGKSDGWDFEAVRMEGLLGGNWIGSGERILGLQEVVWVFWATSEGWKHACEHLEPQIFLVA